VIEPIETEHLRIRDVRSSDGDAFYRYMKHEDYWRHLPMAPPTPDWVQSVVERSLQEQAVSPRTRYFLAAASKETGEVVGEAILRIESLWHGQAEIGWGVDREHTGRGLGTQIGRATLRLGFDLGLHRLYAQCRVANGPSLRIMEKLGMTPEGVMRENVKARGEWWSSSQWSILRSECRPPGESRTQ
jgi:[ribosomal protein S5]-alanine N-acetyltransferase